MANGFNGINMKQVIEWFVRVVLFFCTLILGYAVNELNQLHLQVEDNNNRLIVIESNRFTSRDGLELMQQLSERPTRAEIQAMLNRLEDRLTKGD